jgi:hypothetical protein
MVVRPRLAPAGQAATVPDRVDSGGVVMSVCMSDKRRGLAAPNAPFTAKRSSFVPSMPRPGSSNPSSLSL